MKKTNELETVSGWELRNDFEPVVLNQYGYYELRNMNTPEERKERFETAYFQEYSGATYEKVYSESELQYMLRKYEEKEFVIAENLKKIGNPSKEEYSLLDIACGEGYLLRYFQQKGKQVKGIDVGSYAIEHHNPDLLSCFEKGDFTELLPEMAKQGITFDVINMDRIVDMILDVENCLQLVKHIMKDTSIVLIKVANNYTKMQQMLLQTGELKKEYWLDAPDHTGYFNREGLIRLMESQGFTCLDFYADTFVELNLLNPLTNYYEKPETGKACHEATVRLDKLMHTLSLEKKMTVYRTMCEMDMGREIIGVFRRKV